MKKILLDFLGCPYCQVGFECDIQKIWNNEIIEGELLCQNCQRKYLIINVIPRILPNRLPDEIIRTSRCFDYEWHKYPRIYAFHEGEFLDYIYPLTTDFFKNKIALDVGCGNGRHVYFSSKFGAKQVIGVEISSAVEVAYQNIKHLPNAHIIQADIYNLPFRKKFDYIYSLGVLHHLPDPELGFNCLLKHLKERGEISVWVYAQEGNEWIQKFVSPLRKSIINKLSKTILFNISRTIAGIIYFLIMFIYKPINKIILLKFLRPFLFYNSYFYQQSKYPFHYLHHNIFDHLAAPITYYINKAELIGWFNKAKLKEIEISYRNENSWRGHAEKIQ